MKKNLLVLFGGKSSEHDVSVLSARNVLQHINREDYNVYIIGITKQGRWLYVTREEELETGEWIYGDKNAYLLPDATKQSVAVMSDDREQKESFIRVDVCFPVLHGKNGEDGTVQGLLDLSGIPYVGCGVLSSATAMDKLTTKILVKELGIRQAKHVSILPHELVSPERVQEKILATLDYPVFVKPANAGSSVGVSKARNDAELATAIGAAAVEDRRILVEEAIVGREIECAVFSDGVTRSLGVGEVVAANEFYDFEAKYHNAASKTVVDPVLPAGVEDAVKRAAERIFDALDCYSLSRVDFFLEEGTNEIVFNEINTMPGFTAISMYAMLARKAGLSNRELIAALIDSAFKRGRYGA
ncbi:MAG: D-alanine--D-alanine ligase family protein [Eubacteriales bacterium]|nr:D-alanine--D-alanine ligase family protein [Eubacteriales bacterium]